MAPPFSGEAKDDGARTPPAQSSLSMGDRGRNESRAEDAATRLERDFSAFRMAESSEAVDTRRSASPAPTYRTVESQMGGRSASPAPSYATVDPMFGRSDEPSALLANPDPERILGSQRHIEELIRQSAIDENLRYALEHHPETYGGVRMLWVPIEVNGRKGRAVVGSGANRTIVSAKFATASGIRDMVDTRYGGVAHGAGTAKISGHIPDLEITVGHIVLATSVTVMADDLSVDMLLGLNTLSQHQACIDIKQNSLVFQGHAVGFLGEADENGYQEGRPALQDVKTLKPIISCDQLQQSPARKSMLCIPIEINALKCKAMVDSGSEPTIVSLSWATSCGIARLIDTRYAARAQGFGTASILGRIHSVPVKIGKTYISMALLVMDPCPGTDMLLGVNFLRRFDACIDLGQDALLVQNQKVPFLSDLDVPLPLETSSSTPEGSKKDDKSKIGPATTNQKKSSGVRSYTPARPAPVPPKGQLKEEESAQPQSTSRWAPNLVSRIVEMGFSHDQAVYALDMTNGDLELAISALI